MKLRSDYKDEFVKKHGVKLGLMSCFVKVPANLVCCKLLRDTLASLC
jgi:pyruvate/2-oxoglutarate dehydrogenase complex dihydrolipoamide acyltransferase (E2) component